MGPVTEARVPERLPEAAYSGPVIEATAEAILLRLPRVGRFLVEASGSVTVERAVTATDADLDCFLDGPVEAARALLAGALPLRAAAVSIGGRAVALAGLSGAGKSAVAAALALRGHPTLADAVTVADDVVRPRSPEPVLWPDMVEALGLDPSAGEVVRPALAKRAFRFGPDPDAVPPATVVMLASDPLQLQPAAQPFAGAAKTSALLRACWFRRLTGPIGLEARRFELVAELSSRVRVVGVTRPRECSPADVAAVVEEVAA